VTCTEPGLQMRDLSLRSTSVHMVSSDSSFFELSSVWICCASPIASAPRLMVPGRGPCGHARAGRSLSSGVIRIT
jgi:hypothetical protein